MKNKKQTERGFNVSEFTDCYGTKCSIQKSSSAMEDRIWLGANKLSVQKFHPNTNNPWREVDFSGGQYVGNERMHLNQDQVKDLLPYLIKFAETGDF